MVQVWDNDLFLFYCDELEADLYADQGFNIVKE
jgi:hypothetical protein